MTKTKRQLRAEAVERLKSSEYHTAIDDVCSMLGWGHEPHFEGATDALIDLLTDDEPTNGTAPGTNGTALPDCDPLDLMMNKGVRQILEALGIDQGEKKHVTKMLRVLADMVERDYVPHAEIPDCDMLKELRKYASTVRYDYDPLDDAFEPDERLSELCEHAAEMVERDYVRREAYEDLRDEFVWSNTFLHRMGKKCGTKDVPSLVAYVEQLEAEVKEYESVDRHIAETDSRWEAAIRDLERMTAERDEWKTKFDAEIKARNACARHAANMEAERDEWRTKAEQAMESYADAKDARDMWHERYVTAERAMNAAAGKWARADAELRSIDGVARSNLEWLWESEPDFIADWVSKASYCRHCAFWDGCDGSMGADNPKCYRGNREWLLSEHVHEPCTFQAEKVQGFTENASETPDGESRTNVDMSEKGAFSVRSERETSANDGSARENDVSADGEGANDGNANLGTYRGTSESEASTVAEADSREKLEADAEGFAKSWAYDDYVDEETLHEMHSECLGGIIALLDRQKAITERESRRHDYGETVGRWVLLASDGQPIEVGQTLYGEDGEGWAVTALHHGDKYPVEGEHGGKVRRMKARCLRH